MRLLLIRHGQSVGNAAERIQGPTDEPLTELGRAQALALAERLNHQYSVSALYSSPLRRARETAEVIAEILGLNVTFDERLQEHDPGVIAGMKRQEIEVHYPELVRRWHETPWRVAIPGEEDIFSFQSRVQGAMSNIVIEHADDGTVAVVAHGGTLGAYLTGLLGLDYRRRPPWVFDNASLSTVVLGGVRPRIVLLNDTCHLNHSPRRGPG